MLLPKIAFLHFRTSCIICILAFLIIFLKNIFFQIVKRFIQLNFMKYNECIIAFYSEMQAVLTIVS